MTKRCLTIAAILMLTVFALAVSSQGKRKEQRTSTAKTTPTPPKKNSHDAAAIPATGGDSVAQQPNVGASPNASTSRPGNQVPSPATSATPRSTTTRTQIADPSVTIPAGLGLQDPDASATPQYLVADDLGLLGWLTNDLLLGLVGLAIALAFLLHLVHLLMLNRVNRDLDRVIIEQRNLASANRSLATPNKSAAIDSLSQQLGQHGEGLNQLLTRLNQIDTQLTIRDGEFRDAVRAVALTANWMGQARLQDAYASDGAETSEEERAALMAILEHYEEPLRQNAGRVEGVAQAMVELVERLEGRAFSSPELLGRIHSLYEGIGRFDQWHKNLQDQLTKLRSGSYAQRNSQLQGEQERLMVQINSGTLSVAQMVQKSRALLDHYAPPRFRPSAENTLPPADQETSLKKLVDDAPDYLMDWYDQLFHLQNQLGQGQRSPVEAEAVIELAKIQAAAREALGKFDIQPEAIQIGQTTFDRRLHDASLIRQSAQFPTNTVVEVHNCGFRRMSSGEVLRRPQVVVAGAAANQN